MSNVLRNLPSVNELLESPQLRGLVDRVNHNVVVSNVRSFLDNLRGEVQSAAAGMNIPSRAELAERIAQWISRQQASGLRTVINATGTLLPFGLGGPPLADDALHAAADIAAGYAAVDMDLSTGEAAQRGAAIEKLLNQLTMAEAALVVNNNAAALILTLAALAPSRDVLVSRGQLVEIDEGFRLPESIAASGAILRELGTANKTTSADYSAALGESTAAILHVQTGALAPSAAHTASLEELVVVGRRQSVPVIDIRDSGALIDLGRYGIENEGTVADSIRAGADLVLLSGDKLMGGPPCGIIAGRRAILQRLVRHPLMRAMRSDKLTLAALQATLHLYADAPSAEQAIPLLSLLATPLENLRNRAERLAPQMQAAGGVAATVEEGVADVGGSGLPGHKVPTCCIALMPLQGSLAALQAGLRSGRIAVIARPRNGRLLIDLRSVLPRQDIDLVTAVQALGKQAATDASPTSPEAASSHPTF